MSDSRSITPMNGVIGADVPRVDGRLKVTGQARYASDTPISNLSFGYLATSAIAKGRVRQIDETAARAVPGVLEILTHENVGRAIKPGKMSSQMGYMHSSIAPLADDRVHYGGQIVALVVAETFEAAREAAHRLDIEYEEEEPSATFGSPGSKERPGKSLRGREKNPSVGDADDAIANAPIVIDAWYGTPTQHHNPLELFSCICAWEDDGKRLAVWEGSQNVRAMQHGLAKQLGVDQEDIRVISPYIGGAFGSRGALGQHTAIVALAAKRLGRPVKLVAMRSHGFTIVTYRAETRHHIRLGANRDGSLQALVHEGWEVTSRPDRYNVSGVESTTRLYGYPNARGDVFNVHVDRNTPGFMRAPPETPYVFALESAIDELAYALEMDPVELRRKNDTKTDPINGHPFSSRALVECFDAASDVFGWQRRDPRPGSMRDGDWLVGWGCASSIYATQMGPAAARVVLHPSGSVTVQTGAHDVGTGAYTVIGQTAADLLGVPISRVTVELGDSRLPAAPISAGSNTTASVCTAVAKACEEVRARLAESSVAAQDSPLKGGDAAGLSLANDTLRDAAGRLESLGRAIDRAGRGEPVEGYAENTPDGIPPIVGIRLVKRGYPVIKGGGSLKDRSQYAFGAQFVEVRVHARTAEVRVRRVVGAYAFGRIMNPRTAKSQLMGGQIWGVSSALHEATEIDERLARYHNDDLEKYLIPVNADIQDVQTIMLPERDEMVNPLGIKGVGELGTVGMNAAIANAVYHATAVRVRELPIRLEQLLDSAMLRDPRPGRRQVVGRVRV